MVGAGVEPKCSLSLPTEKPFDSLPNVSVAPLNVASGVGPAISGKGSAAATLAAATAVAASRVLVVGPRLPNPVDLDAQAHVHRAAVARPVTVYDDWG